ncbi:MAG: membrane protein insertase YidC [Flammeovirgaceae bacterium]|nr:membrane protein insertase YidC [Flammeovirgaceae bacterium]
MENNKLVGYLLILLLLITYYTYFVPEYEKEEINNSTEKVDEKIIKNESFNPSVINENIVNSNNQKDIDVENGDLIITFSNQGAYIKKIVLKNHISIKNIPVELINGNSSFINYSLKRKDSILNFSTLIFDHKIENINDSIFVKFSFNSTNKRKIDITYKIPKNGFVISNDIKLDSRNEFKFLNFYWTNNIIHHEKNYEYEKTVTSIYYYNDENGYDYLSAASTNTEEIEIKEPLKWISNKQQFFSSAIINSKDFKNTSLKTIYNEDTSYIKNSIIKTDIDIENQNLSFSFYFGPNQYDILKKLPYNFDRNVYLGWWGVNSFNKYIIVPIFNFLEKSTNNYGLIIFIMVILIRIIITPFTYKSHISMAKMKILNPEINKIREKYPGDMQKSQVEIMELYQKTGVNPLGGCLPILFQLPILISVFYFLPNSVELRNKSFLWAEDLSSYDSILDLPFSIPLYGDHVSLFTLLMTVSTLLINMANTQMQTMQGPMKIMQYVLPFMFLFIFNSFSSGLTYYYFLSNLISYGQIYLFKTLVNEEKLKNEIDFNRKQNLNKNKSKFKLKLEEAMKANLKNQKNLKKK